MSLRPLAAAAALTVLLAAAAGELRGADTTAEPAKRSFQLSYGATLTGLPPSGEVRVWLPVPPSDDWQTVKRIDWQLPTLPLVSEEPKYGNRVLFFRLQTPASGSLRFATKYLVTRREVRGLETGANTQLDDLRRRLFLAPSSKIPITGKPIQLLDELQLPRDPLSLGRLLYDRVDQHVSYDKSRSGFGNGDVLWVCDSRTGNCTDFHSLFISLARSQGIPAKFEIGLPLPPERGQGTIPGYHCWAYFFIEKSGWVPVDISEADKHPEMKDYYFGNLTENRVTLSVGRDISLVPSQAGPPLNYFVYPYVEVDGTPLPKPQIELDLSYRDWSPD